MPRFIAMGCLTRLLPVSRFDAIAASLGIDRGMDTFLDTRGPASAKPANARSGIDRQIHA